MSVVNYVDAIKVTCYNMAQLYIFQLIANSSHTRIISKMQVGQYVIFVKIISATFCVPIYFRDSEDIPPISTGEEFIHM